MIDHDPHDLLEHVFDDEPPHADPVAEVYRRAETLRRRRARAVLASAACAIMLVALTGYGLTSAMLPRLGAAFAEGAAQRAPQPSTTTGAAAGIGVDQVRPLIAAHLRDDGLQLAAEDPEQGEGWREYKIVDLPKADPNAEDGTGGGRADPDEAANPNAGLEMPAGAHRDDGDNNDDGDDNDGDDSDDRGTGGDTGDTGAPADAGPVGAASATRARGAVRVAVYTTPGGLCFPVTSSSKRVCAKTSKTGSGVEYARYTDDTDVNDQVNQVIARRTSDGRTVVVMVSGVPGTGSAKKGRPPLSALKAAGLALDRRLPDAFGSDEWCDRPDPDCPTLKVPMPDEG